MPGTSIDGDLNTTLAPGATYKAPSTLTMWEAFIVTLSTAITTSPAGVTKSLGLIVPAILDLLAHPTVNAINNRAPIQTVARGYPAPVRRANIALWPNHKCPPLH